MNNLAKLTEYINRGTQTGSVESNVQQLVRKALRAGTQYLEQRDAWGARESVNEYHRALAMAEAVAIATGDEITYDEMISAANELHQNKS